MTFSFIFLTITIKKRSYSKDDLEMFLHEQKIIEEHENRKNRYYNGY